MRRKNEQKKKQNVYRSLMMITQFGINMIVPVFLCTFAGIFLDKWLHITCFSILLFFVGALAGFRNIFLFAKRIFQDEESEKDR